MVYYCSTSPKQGVVDPIKSLRIPSMMFSSLTTNLIILEIQRAFGVKVDIAQTIAFSPFWAFWVE